MERCRARSLYCAEALKTNLGILVVSSVACGWFGTMFRPEFSFLLSNVEVETAAEKSASSYAAGEGQGLSYEDDWLAWGWSVQRESIEVELMNKGPAELFVDWTKAGLRTINARQCGFESPQAPNIISSGERIHVVLDPGEYALSDHRERTTAPLDWIVPVMPGIATTDRQRAERFGSEQLGKSIVLRVPVSAGDVTRDYTFTFLVDDYWVEQIVGT